MLFDYRPNWKEPVQVGLAYRTDIFKSRSGKEQRRALRGEPRKTIEFTIGIYRDKLRSFQRLMARWQSRPVTMGDPTRHVTLESAVAINSITAPVSREAPWLTAGATVMFEYGDDRELRVIESVLFDTVTFVSPAERAWGFGASVRPVVSGYIDSKISADHLSGELAEVTISLAVDPGTEPVFVSAPGIFIHEGREIFPYQPDWSQAVETTFQWDREQVDFGHGRIVTSTPFDFGTNIRKSAFLNRSADDAQAMENFYHRAKGQQGEFYWPSGLHDLPLAAALVGGTDYLRTPGTETFEDYAGDTVYKAVAITLHDGRTIYRSIVGMVVDGTSTVIQFSKPWLFDIPVEQVDRVSWLTASRFASDQFGAEWLTNEVMQTQLAIQTLEDLPVESPLFEYDGAAEWALESWGAVAVTLLGRFDWLVNVLYPAIFFIPDAWVRRGERDVDRFDVLVNVTYPGVFD